MKMVQILSNSFRAAIRSLALIGLLFIALTTESVAAAAVSRPLEQVDLEAWLDGFMPASLSQQDIAGAVVVVVKDGKILLSKGYGYADAAKRKPVDPATTLFRPGSVSKLFTWTAIMQLVEQGKIGLDADINTYLDFKVTGKDGAKITPRHLLTHRAGFEAVVNEQILLGPAKAGLTPNIYLKRWVPKRIFKPGTTPAYSNYGTRLAGYIVERVSGMPFENYVERNIFAPLGMTHSTFRQPLPASLLPYMSKGYLSGAGPTQPFETVMVPAAGSLSASGNDMARFMIAHLQKGRLGSAQILKPETADMMHNSRTVAHPQLDAMLLGFYETNINSHRVIAHGGTTIYFHSYLRLFPNDNVGIFMSINSAGKGETAVYNSLFEGFANRYFPAPSTALQPFLKEGAARDADLIAGQYQSSGRSESNFGSITNLISPASIERDADGNISFAGQRYIHIGPLLWRSEDGKSKFAATIEQGKVKLNIAPIGALEPYPASKAPAIWQPLGATIMVAALAWPISALSSRYAHQPMAIQGEALKAYHASRAAALFTLVVIGAWLAVIDMAFSDSSPPDFLITLCKVSLLLGLLALIASAIWYSRTAWRYTRRSGAIFGFAMALAGAILLWITYAHNFFNFSPYF
jgi:CubicO group peptidase (beta-lactamase class C family)